MPFTPKIKADYIELINYALDKITFDSIEDFGLVQQALQLVIDAKTTDIERLLPEKYKETILLVDVYLKKPENYVQSETDYDEYIQIIKDCITVKKNELELISEEQKELYVRNRPAIKDTIAANQTIMSRHTPPQPGTDAHVVPSLEPMQETFNMPRAMDMYSRFSIFSSATTTTATSQAVIFMKGDIYRIG